MHFKNSTLQIRLYYNFTNSIQSAKLVVPNQIKPGQWVFE